MTRDRTKEHAPGFRRGATAEAIRNATDIVFREDGEVEVMRPRRDPVEASGVRDLAAKLAEKAMRALEEDMDHGEPRERQEAARTLAVVCAKLMGDEAEKPPDLSPEERRARLLESLRAPDPELLAAMLEAREEILKALEKTKETGE